MMERDGHAGGPMNDANKTAKSGENAAPEKTWEKQEPEAVATENIEP